MATELLPVLFISHGGGPFPFLKSEMHGVWDKLEDSLRDLPRHVGERPKAFLVISAHWERPVFTVMSNPKPPMLYDYSGFPPHTYQLNYPAPGSPELAARIEDLLEGMGIAVDADDSRGFDHGTFIPFMLAYPKADIPVVQLSIREDYDPAAHLAVGRALKPLRKEGIAIIASGYSYHNLQMFGPQAKIPSKEFDHWLNDAVVRSNPDERVRRLIDWSNAPFARIAHPQEDHLIPLMVAVGAAEQEPASVIYHEENFFGGMAVSSFRFGAKPSSSVSRQTSRGTSSPLG